MYRGYSIAFDEPGKWNFVNHFAKEVVIFGVDNSLSIFIDSHKNCFLALGEGLTDDFNDNGGAVEKFCLNLFKQR